MLTVRSINQAGLELIQRFEGLKLDAYQDIAGIWTIGYGHTKGVQPGMHILPEEATEILMSDLVRAQMAVDRATASAETGDNQFAAMVALCFNVGAGNFRQSQVISVHLMGRNGWLAAANCFLLWNKARIHGVLQEIKGLTARREAERALYLKDVPSGEA